VRCHTADAGEYAVGFFHADHVLRVGLRPDQDDPVARVLLPDDVDPFDVEDRASRDRSARGGKALSQEERLER